MPPLRITIPKEELVALWVAGEKNVAKHVSDLVLHHYLEHDYSKKTEADLGTFTAHSYATDIGRNPGDLTSVIVDFFRGGDPVRTYRFVYNERDLSYAQCEHHNGVSDADD